MKRIFLFVLLIFIIPSNIAMAKVYENTQYQFRIVIPDDWEYRTPRGNNITMTATHKFSGATIVIMVKPFFVLSKEEYNKCPELFMDLTVESMKTGGINVLSKAILDIPDHKVGAIKSRTFYNYPNKSFTLSSSYFFLFSNAKHYAIAISYPPELEDVYGAFSYKILSSFSEIGENTLTLEI